MNKNIIKLILIGCYVLLSTLLWWTCVGKSVIGTDDANIYMVYMRNFADGHGFVYNIGSEKVEGFTSLLWALIGSLFYKISSSPEICLLILNVILITYSLWKLISFMDDYFEGKRLITPYSFLLLGLLELVPGYFDWTVLSLMETGLWSSLLILTGLNIFEWEINGNNTKSNFLFIFYIILLVITRPESYLWGIIFIAIRFIQIFISNKWNLVATIKSILPVIISFLGMIGLLSFWRLRYFGYILPNTYYAKVSSNFIQNFLDGFKYDIFYFIWYNMLLLISILFMVFIGTQMIRKKIKSSPLFIYSFLFVLVTIAIPLYSGGDHFKNGRFIQPSLPLIWFCLILCIDFVKAEIRNISVYVLIVLVLVYITFTPLNSAYKILHDKDSPIKSEFTVAEEGRKTSIKLNLFFKEQGKYPSQGVIDAGGRAFSYKGFTNDLMGLNNSQMAHADKVKGKNLNKSHASFNKQVFYNQKPDLFWLIGNFKLVQALDTNTQLVPNEFNSIAYKNIHLDQKFKDTYLKVAIFKKNEAECLTIYANRAFLIQLKPEIYSYKLLP